MIRLAVIAALLPLPLAAQEVVGTMSGTLGGQPVSYSILDGEGIATGWEEAEDGLTVHIEAAPANTPASDDNLLRLTFTADAAAREPTTREATAELVDDGETWTGSDEGVELALDGVEVTGDSLLVRGNVRVTLTQGDGQASVVSDEGRNLSADIQATILRD